MIGRVGRPSAVGVRGIKAGPTSTSTDAPTARPENSVGSGRGFEGGWREREERGREIVMILLFNLVLSGF